MYQWLFLRAVGQTLGTITTKLVRFPPWTVVKLVKLVMFVLWLLVVKSVILLPPTPGNICSV